MKIVGDDVQYLFLPLAHVLGRELEWCAIHIGCETAFSRGTALIKEDLAPCARRSWPACRASSRSSTRA